MSDCDCVKENPSFFRRLFANTALDGVCKMELKMRITLLEMEKEKLSAQVKKQGEQIEHLDSALSPHEACVHLNSKPEHVLYERQDKARKARALYRSKFFGKHDPVDYT